MAKYTITLSDAKALMTEDQISRYDTLLRMCVPADHQVDFVAAFDRKYNNREIANGTPAGFLDDLASVVYLNMGELNDLWTQYDSYGMFGATARITDTETPNITKKRTPDLTDARTPDLIRADHVVLDDTPQTSGVIAGGYAASVSDGRQTETGTDTVRKTGTETTTETGSRTRMRTEERDDDVNTLIKAGVANLMQYTLRKFASCFILLY